MIGYGPTYTLPVAAGPLRQGEIISSVDQYIFRLSEQEAEKLLNAERKMHPYAVVLTQDCDLAQDFNVRSSAQPSAEKLMSNILLCVVYIAETAKNSGTIPVGSDIWKRIIQNKDERYQYIREVTANEDGEGKGIPPLLIDFKQAFSLPADLLYEQLRRSAKRRAILTSPYREHLSSRYAYFISRVALPRDHHP
ncbi:MAG: hypothetical protein ACYDC6_04720 [Acidobacteriaceae bacterium]